MHDTTRTADLLTGRALSLALAPGVDPVVGVAELVALAAGDVTAMDVARVRLRAYRSTSPGSEPAQLAEDLLSEALVAPPPVPPLDPAST